jgi:UDPglucose--hexose-1-phosphate uridylyltransferase
MAADDLPLHTRRYQAWHTDRQSRAAFVQTLPEIRVDPLSGLRTIVAPGRAERGAPDVDPFVEGNEAQTPPEVYAVREQGSAPDTPGWRVRVFPNRFPALDGEGLVAGRDANARIFSTLAAHGAHEVIVNSPRAVAALADLELDELSLALEVWRQRMRAHEDAACVHLFVNEGSAAGSSRRHTHAQLMALDFVPALIARERERFGAYAAQTMGQQLLGDLVSEEVRRRERLIAVDDEAVLLAAFAAALPYQLMIVPRAPRMRFEDDGPTCAAMLADALARLARRFGESPPLNLWIRTAPRGAEHFCWRIDILPRLSGLAGLELGSGVHLTTVTPEQAAAELRDA